MRQESLTGFVLHQRAYKEKNRLIYFLSKEHGVVHGIGPKTANQFQAYSLYASGKGNLKRFSQLNITQHFPPLAGQALYAGMYLNELLFKVLPSEDTIYHSFAAYAQAISALAHLSKEPDSLELIKLILRRVEYNLLGEMGYGLDFSQDKYGDTIHADRDYVLELTNGFSPIMNYHDDNLKTISGKWLVSFHTDEFSVDDNHYLGIILRQCIDHLLDYKPLKSRELWLSLYNKS